MPAGFEQTVDLTSCVEVYYWVIGALAQSTDCSGFEAWGNANGGRRRAVLVNRTRQAAVLAG